MDSRLQGLWDWWFWHRRLTGELFDVLEDRHLGFAPGGPLPTLGKLCADMADTQVAYISSLETRSLDMEAPASSTPATNVAALRSHFGELDRQLNQALEAVTGDEVDTIRIQRDDEQIPIFMLMSSLVESLLIYHGKISVYARLAGVDLPASWSRYI